MHERASETTLSHRNPLAGLPDNTRCGGGCWLAGGEVKNNENQTGFVELELVRQRDPKLFFKTGFKTERKQCLLGLQQDTPA